MEAVGYQYQGSSNKPKFTQQEYESEYLDLLRCNSNDLSVSYKRFLHHIEAADKNPRSAPMRRAFYRSVFKELHKPTEKDRKRPIVQETPTYVAPESDAFLDEIAGMIDEDEEDEETPRQHRPDRDEMTRRDRALATAYIGQMGVPTSDPASPVRESPCSLLDSR